MPFKLFSQNTIVSPLLAGSSPLAIMGPSQCWLAGPTRASVIDMDIRLRPATRANSATFTCTQSRRKCISAALLACNFEIALDQLQLGRALHLQTANCKIGSSSSS